MERVPTTIYLWISRLAGLVGLACMVIAVITGATDSELVAGPMNWVVVAIAAFLFAIWAVLYELRDQGIKTK